MLIYGGRLLMVLVWLFLLFNLVSPYPRPLNIFINVALIFTALMHVLQVMLLKASQGKNEQPLTRAQQWRIFLFGVFELLAMQKKQKHQQQK